MWERRLVLYLITLFFRLISDLIYLSDCDHMYYARYIYVFALDRLVSTTWYLACPRCSELVLVRHAVLMRLMDLPTCFPTQL